MVIHDGRPVIYLERGGKSALTFSDEPVALTAAAEAVFVPAARVLTDELLRRRLSAGALEVSHRFTWTQSQLSFASVVAARLEGRITDADDPGATRPWGRPRRA